MPTILIIFFLSFLCCSCTQNTYSTTHFELAQPANHHEDQIPRTQTAKGVILAPGDIVSISVWGQDDLNQKVSLDTNGHIYYPLIGRIDARGMTIPQLQKAIQTKIAKYYVNPKVTVIPENLAGHYYYVLGEVQTPGKIQLSTELSVLEAIGSAGGPNKDADNSAILLRKESGKLLLYNIPVQYETFNEQDLSAITVHIKPRDILYLPPSNIADIEDFMIRLNNILNPLLSIERGIVFWPELTKVFEGEAESQVVLTR